MSRIGVFVCWCGENIARTVDVDCVVQEVGKIAGVKCAVNYKYMCSDPGQTLIKTKIKEEKLDAIVVAACSPHMHQNTFRAAAAAAGLNPYLVKIANIREHCSWVHPNREEATTKAISIISLAVERVRHRRALNPIKVPILKRALVIGGGVAGIQAALDIADAGHEVVLVERNPSIGGKMAGLSETFPTLDCSQCILTPRMVEVAQHGRIKLHTWSEIIGVEGYVGNFTVKIRKKARYVDITKCTGCGECWTHCPSKRTPSEFDYGLGMRTAIYVPFPQAVPARPVIDPEACIRLKRGKGCGLCAQNCGTKAINYEDKEEIVTEQVGAIVVSTGFELFDISLRAQDNSYLSGYPEYGYGELPDVIDGLKFERLASASGPTGGEIVRPSDKKVPKDVVFVQCVGSRDPAHGMPYCSKICCMYTAKHSMLLKHKIHDAQAHVFYIDVRAAGKGYEEFYRRAVEQDGTNYYRGRVSRIVREGEKLVVSGVDTVTSEQITINADMVVLATAIRPSKGAQEVGQMLNIGVDGNGFFNESHPKLRPVETNTKGIFVCGACQAPKDIPETVAQASAAASKVLIMFAQGELTRDPEVASINERLCAACFTCVRACPYHAIEEAEIRGRDGKLIKRTARVNPGLCMGCGTCVAICPSKCAEIDGFSDEEIYSMLEVLK